MTPTEDCVLGAKNQTKIDQLRQDFDKMAADIKQIKEKLLGRPSWWVVAVITALTGATSTLAMYIIMAT